MGEPPTGEVTFERSTVLTSREPRVLEGRRPRPTTLERLHRRNDARAARAAWRLGGWSWSRSPLGRSARTSPAAVRPTTTAPAPAELRPRQPVRARRAMVRAAPVRCRAPRRAAERIAPPPTDIWPARTAFMPAPAPRPGVLVSAMAYTTRGRIDVALLHAAGRVMGALATYRRPWMICLLGRSPHAARSARKP